MSRRRLSVRRQVEHRCGLLWAGALITALAACAGAPKDRTAPGLYAGYCARCHGDDGRGDPRKRQDNPGLDLTVSEAVRQGQPQQVRQRIAEGHGSMPAFAEELTAEELDALVELVMTFVPAAAGDDGTPAGG